MSSSVGMLKDGDPGLSSQTNSSVCKTQADSENPSVWDRQVGGNHYQGLAIQPTEYIVKNELNFVEGNVIKYVTRYKLKGGIQDLEKARHYLDILIQLARDNSIEY